ncbi:benzoate/H(+) symporter BenE family transporter [Aliiglaciecola sp.]|nr:benzoate/H(+) symporter BenE family transporter [Aliiglaciecola sp.]
MLQRIVNDTSLSAISAGFIAVLVGFASATAIVFQAAIAAGANQAQIESWIWALGLGMGLSTLGLSLWYKRPIIIAWSTPGAALIATSLVDGDIGVSVGTFVFVGLLTLVVGITGLFNKIVQLIPVPLAAAMLAGILVQFGIDIFVSLKAMPFLVICMLITYVITKNVLPRYTIPVVLIVGIVICGLTDTLQFNQLSFEFAQPVWVTPTFTMASIIGIGIPLFIVTMTSQNLPGVAILKSSGYQQQPVSPVISTTGITTAILAPFGGFTFNLAAITAAICTSDESHPDPKKRYIAGVSVGVFNILAGLFGTAVVSLFAAFPQAFVASLAGLALLSTIANSLQTALASGSQKDAAIITFLFTASGISFFCISSAFWGILLGLVWVHAKIK